MYFDIASIKYTVGVKKYLFKENKKEL